MRDSAFTAVIFLVFWSNVVSVSNAQMINTPVPHQQLGDSYYNGLGISWGLRCPGCFFNFPGANAIPSFAGIDPDAGISGGFGGQSGNVSGNLGFNWTQGSSRFSSFTAPSVTTMDGYPGSFFSGTQRPFTTSLNPVVGSFVASNEGIRQAGLAREQATLNSIAQRKAQATTDKAKKYWDRALKAEESGNLKMARANYRLALPNAREPLRSEIIRRMNSHNWRP